MSSNSFKRINTINESNIMEIINPYKQEIINLQKENSFLKSQAFLYAENETNLKNAKNQIQELKEFNKKTIKEKEDEIRKIKSEIDEILMERELERLKYNKNMTMVDQRMSVIHQVELENSIYREELEDMKNKNIELTKATEKKLKELEIENKINYDILRETVINDLNEQKKDLYRINIEKMEINNKLMVLQNHKLIKIIEQQKRETESLINENKKLKKLITTLENDIDLSQKVQVMLITKINKNHSQNSRFINYFNQTKAMKSCDKNNLKNQDEISHIFPKRNKKINISLKKYQQNKEEKNSRTNSPVTSFFYGKASSTQASVHKNQKSRKSHKNDYRGIGKLEIKFEQLKYKFEKYKKIYDFLEESLKSFFNEKEFKNKSININIENLKKFEFNLLNEKEKYGVLVLLMRHLLPLLTLNFNSNCNIGKEVFTTNLNILDNDFNKTNTYFKDKTLQKVFIGKNNKLIKELHLPNNNKIFEGSIPVMRKYTLSNDIKIKNEKYKSIFSNK